MAVTTPNYQVSNQGDVTPRPAAFFAKVLPCLRKWATTKRPISNAGRLCGFGASDRADPGDVAEALESPPEGFSVPLRVDVQIGRTWAACKRGVA